MDAIDTTTDPYTRQLREMLDGRMTAGQRLAEAAAAERATREAHERATRDFSAAFSAALSAGWTDRELRTVFKSTGQAAPTRRPRSGGSTRRHTSDAASAPRPASPTEEHAGTPAPGDHT